jgi:hypothetical protein
MTTVYHLLKVPSHQIRSAWKWYGWIRLDEDMDRGWYTYFYMSSLSFKFKLSSLSGILLLWSVLHAILGFRSLLAFCNNIPKGNRLPFAKAPKVVWALLANFRRIIEHRLQIDWICMRCSITLSQFAERAQITCGTVAKGNQLPFWPLYLR